METSEKVLSHSQKEKPQMTELNRRLQRLTLFLTEEPQWLRERRCPGLGVRSASISEPKASHLVCRSFGGPETRATVVLPMPMDWGFRHQLHPNTTLAIIFKP